MLSAVMPLHGRDDELRALAAVTDGALLLLGEAGTGRTSVLQAAARAAAGRTLLSAGGSPNETGLPGAVLHHLLRPVRAAIAGLAPHQAAALLAAAGLDPHHAGAGATTDGRGHDPLTLPAALLDLLGRLAPVLGVIDDADLADPVSLEALTFAARRLDGGGVTLLFAARSPIGPLTGLPALTLGPLSREAARAMLGDLPGPALPGDVASALIVAADGNPLALRELAASLDADQRRGLEALPCSLPPDSRLRRDYRARLDRLPQRSRCLVLCAAADDRVTTGELATAGLAAEALEPAERAGLLRVDGDRLVFRPALLRRVTTRAEQLAAHRLLAGVVTDPMRRLRHAAAVATGPDAPLAAALRPAAGPGWSATGPSPPSTSWPAGIARRSSASAP